MKQIQVELQAWMGSDRDIANAAWTSSYDKGRRDERSDEDVQNLVARLIADGHSTPVESVVLRFWYRFPIFTDRQHMTHRIASHNGLSGRYRTMPEDFYELPAEILSIFDKIDNGLGRHVNHHYRTQCLAANEIYRGYVDELRKADKAKVITNGEMKRAREVLRGMLPTSGMVERVTMFNLRSFANYQKLRNSDHAQPEIRFVAQEMLRLVKEKQVAPVAIKALEERGWSL